MENLSLCFSETEILGLIGRDALIASGFKHGAVHGQHKIVAVCPAGVDPVNHPLAAAIAPHKWHPDDNKTWYKVVSGQIDRDTNTGNPIIVMIGGPGSPQYRTEAEAIRALMTVPGWVFK